MEKLEKIASIINKARKESFLIGKIEEVVLKCSNVDNYYEIRFYVVNDDEKLLNEFDADVDAFIEAIEYFLLPKLRENFIAEIKETNYLYDDVEIVVICEDVE